MNRIGPSSGFLPLERGVGGMMFGIGELQRHLVQEPDCHRKPSSFKQRSWRIPCLEKLDAVIKLNIEFINHIKGDLCQQD